MARWRSCWRSASATRTVRIVSFTRNFGQMAAILAGLKTATGDLVLHLSADLQDPVELIPRLVQQFEAGNEVVVAYRENREDRLDVAADVAALLPHHPVFVSADSRPAASTTS